MKDAWQLLEEDGALDQYLRTLTSLETIDRLTYRDIPVGARHELMYVLGELLGHPYYWVDPGKGDDHTYESIQYQAVVLAQKMAFQQLAKAQLETIRLREERISELVAEVTDRDRRLLMDMRTQIGNRESFLIWGIDQCGRAIRNRHPISLSFIDLNNFTWINNTYGHDKGDRVLEEVGGCLATSTAPGEHCSRFGGEEFVLGLSPRPTGAESLVEAISVAHERLIPLVTRQVKEQMEVECVDLPYFGLATGIILLIPEIEYDPKTHKAHSVEPSRLYCAIWDGKKVHFLDEKELDELNAMGHKETTVVASSKIYLDRYSAEELHEYLLAIADKLMYLSKRTMKAGQPHVEGMRQLVA